MTNVVFWRFTFLFNRMFQVYLCISCPHFSKDTWSLLLMIITDHNLSMRACFLWLGWTSCCHFDLHLWLQCFSLFGFIYLGILSFRPKPLVPRHVLPSWNTLLLASRPPCSGFPQAASFRFLLWIFSFPICNCWSDPGYSSWTAS